MSKKSDTYRGPSYVPKSGKKKSSFGISNEGPASRTRSRTGREARHLIFQKQRDVGSLAEISSGEELEQLLETLTQSGERTARKSPKPRRKEVGKKSPGNPVEKSSSQDTPEGGIGQVHWSAIKTPDPELRTNQAHKGNDPDSLNLPLAKYKDADLSSVRSERLSSDSEYFSENSQSDPEVSIHPRSSTPKTGGAAKPKYRPRQRSKYSGLKRKSRVLRGSVFQSKSGFCLFCEKPYCITSEKQNQTEFKYTGISETVYPYHPEGGLISALKKIALKFPTETIVGFLEQNACSFEEFLSLEDIKVVELLGILEIYYKGKREDLNRKFEDLFGKEYEDTFEEVLGYLTLTF
jgi:hypothetical protein